MLDFTKKLLDTSTEKNDDPIEIYSLLDRASDKGPLRESQSSVLEDWYKNYKEDKDVIVKLHTGQGKTLIGLLILQSKIIKYTSPVLYLCPNKFLVEQTCEQAKQFGIKFCKVDKNNQLPQDFLDGKSILITNVQLLFNGLSKFGLKQRSMEVNSLVLDDSHACIDTIQDAFTIKIDNEADIYKELFALFESDLEEQGAATIEEIRQKDFNAYLPVPYWAWKDKIKEVISLLVKHREETYILFAWELIKDIITDCQCIVSGTGIEISPYLNPIQLFGTFYKASYRIFMSATTNNDAFFIKGLGLEYSVIQNPLKYKLEKWSGEKMILIPYLMNAELNNSTIVSLFAKENNKRKSGVVAITPSTKKSGHWQRSGAIMPDTTSIQEVIKKLKEQAYEKTIVLTNRYDGIDLPDDTCRILILDGKPFANSLADRLQETYRENSKLIDVKIAQKIEQGLGRAVRGEKDYCIILITGIDLIGLMRSKKLTKYFSAQTNKQIEIGLEAGQFAVEQDNTNDEVKLLSDLIAISIKRDETWKKFYIQKMDTIKEEDIDVELYDILQLEKKAEGLNINNQFKEAEETIQLLIDKHIPTNDKTERAYYLQEMARYAYGYQKSVSNNYQIQAYKLNRILLKPNHGIEFQKLHIDKKRSDNILSWINQFENYELLQIRVTELLSDLSFGKKSDKFEKALHEMGLALGFACERPDKELKKGPDNLWNIKNDKYILFECKNEVDEDRAEIVKSETGQMNTACAWFKTNYNTESIKNILIIPTKTVAASAGFTDNVEILRKKGLSSLKSNFRKYFEEYQSYELSSLTEKQINDNLVHHQLGVEEILNNYFEIPIQKK